MASRISTLAPWFGTNRSLAHHVGAQLAGCTHVSVPFAGGMSELRHLKARTLVVGDLHKHLINLANVLAHDEFGPRLIRELRRVPFHEDALAEAQKTCLAARAFDFGDAGRPWGVRYAEALAYFVCCWMTRSGSAGTGGEFTSGLSVRWDAGGGDSATRYRSAVEGLREWRRIVPRCTFVVRDAFAFLDDVKDAPGIGVYCDAPWPDDGDKYTHKFGEELQRKLALKLLGFEKARVVIRYGDHPLVRELYPQEHWEWLDLTGRTQTNAAKAEVLLVNRRCAREGAAQK